MQEEAHQQLEVLLDLEVALLVKRRIVSLKWLPNLLQNIFVCFVVSLLKWGRFRQFVLMTQKVNKKVRQTIRKVRV